MNHLAHIYLAGDDEELVIGNYIADYLRGNNFNTLPPKIIEGVYMHRKIDTFTDEHPKFREATKLIRPTIGKYAGVAVDIYFDYFLAQNWKSFHNSSLPDFADSVYSLIERQWVHIPDKGRRFYTYMVAHNLLYKYGEMETINRVFNGINSRTKFESNPDKAGILLASNTQELEDLFLDFFQDLKQYIEKPND
jgi:acyl carrier protein phosphodiesterase